MNNHPRSALREAFNDERANASDNATLDDVLHARLSRRRLLGSAMGLAGAGVFGATGLTGCAATATSATPATGSPFLSVMGFQPVAKTLADAVTVPPGYTARVIYALGDPLTATTPAFKNDGSDTQFALRAGDHHDGVEWFSLDTSGRPSTSAVTRGLLAMNHEATTDEKLSSFFLHADGGFASLPRPAAEVDKEMMVHGISVVEVEQRKGVWAYKADSPFNRRITPLSEAAIHGPARGSEHLVTKYSTDGKRARGTLNNCGTGKTPWGTLVSGEENWFGYFHRDSEDDKRRGQDKQVQALKRYGRKAGDASRHGWESAASESAGNDAYARWNNSATASSAALDYRNEMNSFGYIVELDPYDKTETLRKRTALGRMGHENAVFAPVLSGQPVVAYMGDDSRGEYMYKFVSTALWDAKDASPANRMAAGDKYLDQGTLFAARFKDDGSGEWLELSMNNPVLAGSSRFEFKTAADVAVFTRVAADAVGATKMDRPEWGAINPKNTEVYFTLTNNSGRTVDGPMGVDSVNPRSYADMKGDKENKGNVNGHIVRMAHGQAADTTFRWDIFVFGSEAGADPTQVNISRLTDSNDLSSPDGLRFSQSTGLCWIETDDGAYTDQSNCMLLAALPGQVGDGAPTTLRYGEKSVQTHAGKAQTAASLKRFLVGPRGAEITGICETPDGRTLFVNIQHAGENTAMADVGNPSKYQSQWPANAGYGAGQRPRSATVVITKQDGGVIGS